MSTDYDPEKTLEEYGYGSGNKGKTVAIVLLSLLLIAAAGAAAFLGKLWSDEQAELLSLRSQMETFATRVSDLENRNSELSSLLADKQAESERMREEWITQVDTLKAQHAEQLQRTYGQLNEIVYDSKKTLSYIGDIETRLRNGQNLNQEEAAKLSGVINGLVVLHEQYKRPLNEFREVSRYLNTQLATLPEDAVDPLETAPLGKRIFKNRELKQERQQFFENQGRRTALVETQDQVKTAYANAQRQMSSIALNINDYLADLENIVLSNEQSAAETAAFFEKSKEILKVHDRIMNLEPPTKVEVQP